MHTYPARYYKKYLVPLGKSRILLPTEVSRALWRGIICCTMQYMYGGD